LAVFHQTEQYNSSTCWRDECVSHSLTFNPVKNQWHWTFNMPIFVDVVCTIRWQSQRRVQTEKYNMQNMPNVEN